jgi:hypothetical protein
MSPARIARTAALFYVVTFAAGTFALVTRNNAAGLVAGVCYIAVTVLFYFLFRPVNRSLSLLAAAVSLAGIVIGPLRVTSVNPLVFFGAYCLLIAVLIFRSTFLPRGLAVLMAFASLGWFTFLSPPLARSLYPYNFAPGMVGEGVLTLWLLIKAVDVRQWQQQANAAEQPA